MKKVWQATVLLIMIVTFGGCDKENEIIDEENNQVFVFESTIMSDAEIEFTVIDDAKPDILGYKLNEDRTMWVNCFGVIEIDLHYPDHIYIYIKNNYLDQKLRDKYNLLFDKDPIIVTEENSFKHNLMIYHPGEWSYISTDKIYEEIERNYPDINGSFVYFDNYEFAYDKEQIIGYQILSENPIDDNFCQQLTKLTMSDLTNLPDEDKYGYYQLFMITLNFHRSGN